MATTETLQKIETPQIVDSPEQKVALIRLTVPSARIQTAMGPAFNELGAVLRAQNIAPTGPWFAHHFHRPTDVFDFELCSPVAHPVEPTGRVTNGHIRATRVGRTVYTGPYEGLGAGWGEFVAWLEANGHSLSGDFWEVYTAGPNITSDPSQFRTELNAPLD